MEYDTITVHPITAVIVAAAFLVAPAYIVATYVGSGASFEKGIKIAAGFLLFGAAMFSVCLYGISGKLGMMGNLIIPIAWIMPSLILVIRQDWFLSAELSQRWLIGLQLWRAIGAVFLIEMTRGHIPGIFAYPAGIGDVVAALVAGLVLWKYRNTPRISSHAIHLVILVGVIDFIAAFILGFTSSENPFQLFSHDAPNKVRYFPTGLIPFYLVPYAIFFHSLSFLNYLKFKKPYKRNGRFSV